MRWIRNRAGLIITACYVGCRRLYWKFRLGAMGENSNLYPRVCVYSPRNVKIGRNVVINDFVHIWGTGGVTIGDNTLIAAHTVITSQTHEVDAASRGLLFCETHVLSPVRIGSNVWIGSNVSILNGITIGDNSVVAAGAVVARDVPAHVLVAGVPARMVRELPRMPA